MSVLSIAFALMLSSCASSVSDTIHNDPNLDASDLIGKHDYINATIYSIKPHNDGFVYTFICTENGFMAYGAWGNGAEYGSGYDVGDLVSVHIKDMNIVEMSVIVKDYVQPFSDTHKRNKKSSLSTPLETYLDF